MSEAVDNLAKYGQSYQTKVVTNLVTDRPFLEQVSDILETKYFESDTNKWVVDITRKYFSKYKNTPTTDFFKTEIQKIIKSMLS